MPIVLMLAAMSTADAATLLDLTTWDGACKDADGRTVECTTLTDYTTKTSKFQSTPGNERNQEAHAFVHGQAVRAQDTGGGTAVIRDYFSSRTVFAYVTFRNSREVPYTVWIGDYVGDSAEDVMVIGRYGEVVVLENTTNRESTDTSTSTVRR